MSREPCWRSVLATLLLETSEIPLNLSVTVWPMTRLELAPATSLGGEELAREQDSRKKDGRQREFKLLLQCEIATGGSANNESRSVPLLSAGGLLIRQRAGT